MGKKLSEMTLQELWELFPITLTAHNDCWHAWYAEEAATLHGIFPEAERISHIGSTAVASIWAKPIVDILVEVPQAYKLDSWVEKMSRNGYICMSGGSNRISFNKGYTESGFAEKVFHVHLRFSGDNDELYFRDYLNDFPDIAAEYENLKCGLWKKYEHDRDAYTAAKTEFVRRYTRQAKEKYPGRY